MVFRSKAHDLFAMRARGLRLKLTIAIIALLSSIALMIPAKQAKAHPHTWIDVAVRVVFDSAGKAIGLHEVWLFDELYTAFALEGLAKKGSQPTQTNIDALLRRNMANLAGFSYFTKVKHNGAEVAFRDVTEMSSRLSGNRLKMSFYLSFKESIDPREWPLKYAIYDPTYYIEMLHVETDDAIRLADAPTDCTHRLIEPAPSMENVMLAQALDRTQTAGDGLGALFAETVEIRCK